VRAATAALIPLACLCGCGRGSVTVAGDPSSTTQPPLPQHRLLLIVAGQSNATGYLSDAVDPKTHVNYFAAPYRNGADTASTIAWDQSFVTPARTQRPVPLDTPQTRIGSQTRIFGPEVGLARRIYADTGRAVTIVKVAFGGQTLAAWNPSAPNGLFHQMVSLVTTTIDQDAKIGRIDTIGAFYWYQGEADANTGSQAAMYQANLRNFLAHVRSDLPMSPSTPIALAKESTPQRPGDSAVRAADDWATANVPGVVAVDTLGLPRTGGNLHLSNTGELELGRRLAVATEARMP
jgi:hypothetical protein